MFIGQMGCEALNFLLKRAIKEERPKREFPPHQTHTYTSGGPLVRRHVWTETSEEFRGLVLELGQIAKNNADDMMRETVMNGKGYGMPSSHAQFLTYFSLSLTLFLLLRHHPPSPPNTTHKDERPYSHQPLNLAQKLFLSLLTCILAASVAVSRIYLNYHTPMQVVVGCVAGAVSAAAWFWVTEWARREGWVEWGYDCWVGRMGRWRDLVVEEDLPEAGWRVWEERRRKRREIGERKGR